MSDTSLDAQWARHLREQPLESRGFYEWLSGRYPRTLDSSHEAVAREAWGCAVIWARSWKVRKERDVKEAEYQAYLREHPGEEPQ